MNQAAPVFNIVSGFVSPAPEMIDVNERLTEKLDWYTLEDRVHALGIRLSEYDKQPRDLLAGNSKKIINKLKQSHSRIIVRNILEGRFLRLTQDIYRHIHHTIAVHNLNPNHFCYMSSNLDEQKRYNAWCVNNSVHNKIQVFGFLGWREFSRNNYIEYKRTWQTNIKAKQFLCLNRRVSDAPHRKSTLYHLQRLGLMPKGMISNSGYHDVTTAETFGWNPEIQRASEKQRIIDIDSINMDAGAAADINTADLHRLTGFSVVTESSYSTDNNTMRFYTEKTLRAVLYGHPFVIIGEPGANTDLIRIGVEPYTDLFDINTDYISDVDHRVCAQLESIRWNWDITQMHSQLAEQIHNNRQSILKNSFNQRILKRIERWATDA